MRNPKKKTTQLQIDEQESHTFQQSSNFILNDYTERNTEEKVQKQTLKKYIYYAFSFIVITIIIYFWQGYRQNQLQEENLNNKAIQLKYSSQAMNLKQIMSENQNILYKKFGKYTQDILNGCPKTLGLFHIIDQDSSPILLQRAQFCSIQLLTLQDLDLFIRKWQQQFPDSSIKLKEYTLEQKKKLLIFLKLYFNAGTYVDINISFSSISNRCWSYAVIGWDILFIDYIETNENGITIPDIDSFIRTRFPYTPMLERMIRNLINKKDVIQQCRKRQCLIVKCKNNHSQNVLQ